MFKSIFNDFDELNAIFDSAFSTHTCYCGVKTNDGYELQFILAGIGKENIDISVDNQKLTLIAKKTDNGLKTNILTDGNGEYKREFKLNGNFDVDNIKSKYTDGVLVISIPEKKSKPNEKKIAVE